jgi:hypothetical protein
MKTILCAVLAPLLALSACGDDHPDAGAYTGRFRIDAGTEYAALETPSFIGGACTGWNALEIRKSGAEFGLRDVICWKREGDDITVTDRSGAQRQSGPAALWKD